MDKQAGQISVEQIGVKNIVLDNIPEPVSAFDARFEITYLNKSFTDVFGYNLDELSGKSLEVLHAESVSDESRAELRKTLSDGKTYAAELLSQQKDGSTFICEHKITPVAGEDGTPAAYIGVHRNITERRRAEESLRERERLLTQSEQIAGIGSWMRDLTVNRLVWSDEAYRIFGLESQKFTNTTYDMFVNAVHPEDRFAVERAYSNSLREGKDSYESEHRIVCDKTGEMSVVHEQCVHERDEDGAIVRSVGIVHDITRRKLSEFAVVQEQRLNAISEFASGIGYDFNNILREISSNLKLALTEKMSAKTGKLLESFKKSVNDAASIAKQLQRFSGKGGYVAMDESVEMENLVNDAIVQTRNLWKDIQEPGAEIKIKTDLAQDLCVIGNRGKLRNVIYNLIKNSVDAMPRGGTINIRARKHGKDMCLTYSDTGAGMDKSAEQRVFQPFFSTKGFDRGIGLGMSEARAIIEEHKGDIHIAKTAPGKGTTFEVKLPLFNNT